MSAKRVLATVLIGMGLSLAVWGAPHAADLLTPVFGRVAPGDETATADATGADEGNSGTARSKRRRRARRPGRVPTAERIGTSARTDRAAAPDPAPGTSDAEPEETAEDSLTDTDSFLLSRVANLADFLYGADPEAVPVTLDLDPATGQAVEVSHGRPELLGVHRFVTEGADSVRDTIELTMERKPHLEEGVPVALTGRVVVEGSGEPVSGAELVLSSTFYVRGIQYDHHLREVARATTDGNGEFEILRLNADPTHFGKGGKVYVTVTAAGFAPVLKKPVGLVGPGLRNRIADLALDSETHTLHGRAVDIFEGKPVVGARVFATGSIDPVSYPKDQREALFVGAPFTVTAEDGSFTLTGLGKGLQIVSFHTDDDCLGTGTVQVPYDAELTVAVTRIGGRITGRVLDEYDRPIPMAVVRTGRNYTHSFVDGTFKLENFRGEIVDLVFEHAQYGPRSLAQVIDGRTDVIVRLRHKWPEFLLDVRSQDTDAPVTKIQVTLEFAEGSRAPVPASPYYLSKEGRHAVRVPAGVVGLGIRAEGFEPQTLDMVGRADGDTISLLLLPR